ncbi:hypothetical protein V8D89_009680 [Ganoderma adspersum]
MPSMTTESSSHSHGLHVVIPTTRVPSASAPKTSTAERVAGPNPLDTPGHSHPFSILPRAADTPSTPGHSHGLFRMASASTPTTPKMSARAARRSSLFSMHDADEPEQHATTDAQPERAQQEFALPPTSEVYEEETSADLTNLNGLGDRPFHVDANGTGGNN